MKRRNIGLAVICLLTVTSGSLLAISRTDHEVNLESVLEIWADLARDVDRVGLTITRISEEREMEVGREIEERIAGYVRLMPDPTLQAYVTHVGQPLVEGVQRKGIRYRFYIVDSSAINAFALPGGGIYITAGMLDFLQSEAELAAVLGHEISHVDLKHCIERLQYELVARKIAGRDLAVVTRIAYSLVNLGFNEQQELDADAGAMFLAAKAGYHPAAGVTLFERLETVKKQAKRNERQRKPKSMADELGTALRKGLEQYFATHPPTATRIRHLEKVFGRNVRAWRDRTYYIGTSNYVDRIPRSSDERRNELRSLHR